MGTAALEESKKLRNDLTVAGKESKKLQNEVATLRAEEELVRLATNNNNPNITAAIGAMTYPLRNQQEEPLCFANVKQLCQTVTGKEVTDPDIDACFVDQIPGTCRCDTTQRQKLFHSTDEVKLSIDKQRQMIEAYQQAYAVAAKD